jgi:hypothetical protein
MLRSAQLRFVAIILFAMAASLVAVPARAFSQGDSGATGDSNAAFGDPGDQMNKMFGLDKGGEPSSLSSPAQIDSKSGKSNPYKNFHIESLTSPSDPLSRPHQ